MRFTVILSSLAVAFAARKDVRKLMPEDIGPLHNDAFNQLTEKYRSSTTVLSKLDLMMDISEIMAGYCDENDGACKNLAYEATMKEFHNGGRNDYVQFPESFHDGMKVTVERMYSTIKDVDANNLDDIVNTLDELTNEINSQQNVDILHKTISLSAMSVAKESTKFWHNVFFGSEDHPLRHLKIEGSRRLQDTAFGDIYRIITADVSGIFDNGINLIEAAGTDDFSIVLSLIPILLISVFYFSVPASLEKLVEALA